MHVVVGTIGFAVNALLLAWLARRLLGAPVGWPRTIALSLVLWLTAQPIVTYATDLLGIPWPEAIQAGSGDLASYSLVLLLLAAWILVAEIAVLTVLELLVPTGSLPTPLHLARTWPARTRRARRLATIARVATRHGLGGYLRRRGRRDRPHEALAADLRAALTDGGVTFVKLGQTLATRDDLLPEAYVRELGTLHSDAAPEPWPVVQERLATDLPAPVDTVFASVDPEPLAAASVAQVHAARLATGEDVVVKVQRPRAREQAVADLALVSGLADWLEERTDWGRRLGTRDLAAGFAESLREELDYRVELDNMTAIAAAAGPRVRVPRVWRELSTPDVIVMERVQGEPLSRAGTTLAGLAASDRLTLADDLLATVLRQVLVTGVFHADLHPGNIVLSSTDAGDPALVLLDFGSVGRLDRSTRDALALLLLAFDRQDNLAAADALIEVLGRPAALDDRAFERDLGVLLVGARSTDLIPRMMRVVLAHGFAVPPMVAAAFRTIATLEGSLRVLDPDVDLLTAARRHGQGLVTEIGSGEALRERVESQLSVVLPLLQRLPRRIDRLTSGLEADGVRVHVRGVSDLGGGGFVLGLVREATTALLCAALTLCGVILLTFGEGPTMIGIVTTHGYLGATLLLFGFVLGARLLVVGFRGSRDADRAASPG